MSVLELINVNVTYQKKKMYVEAVRDFSGVFEDGINVIVGYSGCGKSSLLKSILGIVPYKGKIVFDGEDVFELATNERNFSYISQEYALYPHMTVFENIAFPLQVLGASRKEITERVKQIAELTGLTPCLTRKPKHISGGQQQRVVLARAFVKHPTVCLMDEPLSNVDEQSRFQARQYIKAISKATGCMIIYVTHNVPEAMAMADKLFVMDQGRLEISGEPRDVYNSDNEVMKELREGSAGFGKGTVFP